MKLRKQNPDINRLKIVGSSSKIYDGHDLMIKDMHQILLEHFILLDIDTEENAYANGSNIET